MASARIIRWGAVASLAGGAIWVLLCIHFCLTHGLTPVDRKGHFLGLTRLDSAKLVVLPVAFFGVGLVGLRGRQQAYTSRLGTAGYRTALLCLVLLILGESLQFWPVPWGRYPLEDYWDNSFSQIGGPIQVLSTVVLGCALTVLGIDVLRSRALSRCNGLPLMLGLLLLTMPWLQELIHAWIWGAGWMLLGYVLWRDAGKETNPPAWRTQRC